MIIGKLHMAEKQKQQMIDYLQSQGIPKQKIDEIINGDYEIYDTESDLERVYGGLKKHGDVSIQSIDRLIHILELLIKMAGQRMLYKHYV